MVWRSRAAAALVLLALVFPTTMAVENKLDAQVDACADLDAPLVDPGDLDPYTSLDRGAVGGTIISFATCGPDDGSLVPGLVTGHTVYQFLALSGANGIVEDPTSMRDGPSQTVFLPGSERGGSGTTPDEDAIVERVLAHLLSGGSDITGPVMVIGAEESASEPLGGLQAECLAHVDGRNLDARPDPDAFYAVNDFPSDEDKLGPYGGDHAAQDHDPGFLVDACGPRDIGPGPFLGMPTDMAAMTGLLYFHDEVTGEATLGSHVVAVESNDCDPREAFDLRLRGFLDYVDPNGVYHHVQEYDYVCAGHLADLQQQPTSLLSTPTTADAAKERFPWTYTDTYAEQPCELYAAPGPDNLDTGVFDLGHKCNGTIQDLFTERLWITATHVPIYDASVDASYTYGLIMDTCDRLNVQDWSAREPTTALLEAFEADPESCRDGSSFSFDDTERGFILHDEPSPGLEAMMRGTSAAQGSSLPDGLHRKDCRVNGTAWPNSDSNAGALCFPEAHKTAKVDLYLLDDHDGSTALGQAFASHANIMQRRVEVPPCAAPTASDLCGTPWWQFR